MIVAVTGHRPERLKGQEEMIKKWAEDQLIALQPESVYIGMARGTDQLIGGVDGGIRLELVVNIDKVKKILFALNVQAAGGVDFAFNDFAREFGALAYFGRIASERNVKSKLDCFLLRGRKRTRHRKKSDNSKNNCRLKSLHIQLLVFRKELF